MILLGETPSRAFANLFQEHEAGTKIATALESSSRTASARGLTLSEPLQVPIAESLVQAWISNWPRGQGYYKLADDIVRALESGNEADHLEHKLR